MGLTRTPHGHIGKMHMLLIYVLRRRQTLVLGCATLSESRHTLPFSRVYDYIRYHFGIHLVLSAFFWIPERRVLGPKTEYERFFPKSLVSCMRLAILRETKKNETP